MKDECGETATRSEHRAITLQPFCVRGWQRAKEILDFSSLARPHVVPNDDARWNGRVDPVHGRRGKAKTESAGADFGEGWDG
jgi:hypothetical protein